MSTNSLKSNIPNVRDFERQSARLEGRIQRTPVQRWNSPLQQELCDSVSSIFFKLELLQTTGSFKIRGALNVVDNLSQHERENGVVAGTGGNHGIAVAYAAKAAKVNAKIIVPKTINSYRLEAIKRLGADIVQVDTIANVLDSMAVVARDENRTILLCTPSKIRR